jgi:hypothetical protein
MSLIVLDEDEVKIVTWPVTINTPVNGGTSVVSTCHADFEMLAQDDYDVELAKENDVTFLMRVVVGFGDDIQDKTGQPLQCTDETKSRIFKHPWNRTGFLQAYHEAVSGGAAKNAEGQDNTSRNRPPKKRRSGKR